MSLTGSSPDIMPLKIAVLVIFSIIPDILLAQQASPTMLGVVINEIMYAPHSPEPEWVELYNTDSVAIDLTSWQIATGSKSDSLPVISIAAQSYLVITKDSLELTTLRPGKYAIAQITLPDLDNTGSELILRNSVDQTIDSLDYLPSWGGSSGNSLERRNVLKSSTDPGNWGTSQATSGATPGARNSIATPDSTPTVTPAHPLDIILNEIMFAPISPEPEWIELLNTTSDTINIAGWVLAVQGHAPVTIPSINTLVAPDSLIVLSSNDTELAAYRKVDVDRIVRVSLPNLSNTGSTLAIRDPFGDLIDSAWYSGNWIKTDGISIERIDPAHFGYDSNNWKACEDSTGSTILRPNSIRIRNYDLAIANASLSDTSIAFTIINVGLDTIRHTSIHLQIGSIDTMVQDASFLLPSHDSIVIAFKLPQNFYGLFPATAYLMDSLDENHANDTLRFSIAPPIPQDSLVVNEIMFDPQPNSCEWLELYNLSDKWISIDSTRLITGEARPGEYAHIILPLVIAPDSFGIITSNDSIFTIYPALMGRSGITSLGTSSLDLGKDSCFVVLHNQDSSTIDSVHYFKNWQQSLLRKTFAGISLERNDPRGESNDPQNWQASLDTSGATPLAPNSGDTSSTTTPPPASTSLQAVFSPNPFSPDGDGFEDVSTLTVQTGNSTQWALRVRVYDAGGRLVRTLTDATTIVGSATLNFDGKRDNGQTLPPGLYTVLVELTSATSQSSSASSPTMNSSPTMKVLQTLKQETGVAIAHRRR